LLAGAIQIQFKSFQSLTEPKRIFPSSKKFEIKYDFERFEEGNNLLHRNFFKFEMDFELKFGEVKVYF
jgi:hypothetical protein